MKRRSVENFRVQTRWNKHGEPRTVVYVLARGVLARALTITGNATRDRNVLRVEIAGRDGLTLDVPREGESHEM